MHNRTTKQRRAAQRRRAKYAKAEAQEVKRLAFGAAYGMAVPPRMRAKVKAWLARRGSVPFIEHDYSALEHRVLANHMAQAQYVPRYVANLTGRRRIVPPMQFIPTPGKHS